jgi:hypothetical protein
MAILRGGVRIGGFDIRLGLPRDRSLDNVEGDPRFRQKAGGNPETTMGRVQAYVNEAEGFARKARFYVEFFLPRVEDGPSKPAPTLGGMARSSGIGDEKKITLDNINLSTAAQEQLTTFQSTQQTNAVQSANGRRVRAFCSGIEMPERTIETKEIRHHGPAYKLAFDYKSADITATFYCDKFLRERSYFELWQAAVFSTKSHNFNFYDNYVSDINIFQLGQFASRNERDDVTYAVKLFQCFPKTIGPVAYSYDNNAVQTFQVTFTFRYWINYFLERSGNIELGSPNFRSVDVKSGLGAFGGILNKLPPELRRAGVDVLQGLKRRLPIGGITGGRVFPPFGSFPPINL